MSAVPRPQTPEERLTYLEAMLQNLVESLQGMHKKLDKVLEALDDRAGRAWVEKLEARIIALETEVRSRPTYISAGAWSAVLALLGLLVGLWFKG